MPAVAIKQEAIEAIQRLPDLTDMEEIMYRLYVLESIRRGREDAERKDSTPADDVIVGIPGKPESEGNGEHGTEGHRQTEVCP